MSDIQHFAAPPALDASQVDYLILDGSSSMYGQWFDVLASLDAYVHATREARVKSRVLLATFDSTDIHYIHRDVPIEDWTPLRDNPIGSHGGITPLYDSIADTSRRMRDMNPPRASVVFATDGEENGSTHTDLNQARALIKWMEAKGWQVTFIGCDFNNAELAHRLGVNPANAIGVARARLTDATRELAKKRARYAIDGAPMHWSEEDRQQFGGYLR